MIRLLEPWRSRLLWLSLAGNLFAAALFATALTWRHSPPGPPNFDSLVARLAHELPAQDARGFRAAMDRERGRYDTSRLELEAARDVVANSMKREPFDPAETRAALKAMQTRLHDYSERFDDSLVNALGTLSPEGRSDLARSFLRRRR